MFQVTEKPQSVLAQIDSITAKDRMNDASAHTHEEILAKVAK